MLVEKGVIEVMKRYEAMSKEEIIKLLSRSDYDCMQESRSGCTYLNNPIRCSECWGNYLKQEIEVKPRWAAIKSNEDLDEMFKKGYSKGEFQTTYEFLVWLKEKIEVEI